MNIEQNAPQNNSNVQEQGDTYVEPNVTPIITIVTIITITVTTVMMMTTM